MAKKQPNLDTEIENKIAEPDIKEHLEKILTKLDKNLEEMTKMLEKIKKLEEHQRGFR